MALSSESERRMRAATEKAIELLGGPAAAGRLFGISRVAVHMWQQRGKVPAERVLEVERATEGAVSRYQLRPDVFGKRADA